ncbi:hypothetical protein M9R32_04950 [Paenisporosarcina quisquiliarum]|uniref:Uncharacterized protein n=1 Tax=Paenisporosarcina quisquiliarum TaxID=365346 RepID=A0A9X3LEH5_9BACL|nr:hypothetical protein [Paenisporosarcina quisquiliarum]MCZ8536527.1 hypothetical protein [Paenisporosarcina quisquiliarum]
MIIQKAGGILLLLTLFLTGCSEQKIEVEAVEDPNIETIKKYLEIEFNGPDEKAIQVRNDMFEETTDSEKTGIEQYTDYMNETFSPYVEEEEIQELILKNHVYTYHYLAHEIGYSFKTDQIQIHQQEAFKRNYDYQVDVTFEKGGEKNVATLTGFITMSENGKISGIKSLSDSGFYQEMIKISNVGRDNGALALGILQGQFDKTDHKLNKLWSGSENPMDNKPLVEYLNKKYSTFSKDGLENFITLFGFVYPAIAAENGYELSVGEVEVHQDENEPTSYSTSVVVHYKKDGGEQMTATVKGIAKIKDAVEKLEILDDGGLKEDLQK